ncbi:hypothetical protein [Streptomyces sp. MJP52]|uniref:hypothetical protein n=1 Tax=Streptomyces sp. MJP52 TaxID=2940555 RepID=UPI002475FB9B|nr:hypothetical protein [Streptomyces sp. MJP52]MDH6229339.1 hypothetical protein [Streptomyces sp. MJP52]
MPDEEETCPLTVGERILAVLADHPDGLALKAIRRDAGCGTEGGPTTGSVDSAVSQLTPDDKVITCGGGIHRPS